MITPSAADLEAWRRLAATPFGPVPTFAPSIGGEPPTFLPSYGAATSLAPGAMNALTSGAALALRPVSVNNTGAWIGLGGCVLLALTGVGAIALVGYLFWFVPRIAKSGKQPVPCPRCGRSMSVANGAAQAQCSACSAWSTVSWSR